LPLPTLSRSIVIHMQRSDGSGGHRRLDDPTAHSDLNTAFRCARAWARTVELNPEPDMPPEVKTRAADNWRPPISIADSFGPQWGQAARAAAVKLMQGYTAEDVGVTLLADIRAVFDTLGVDRLASPDLVQRLIDLEDGSGRISRPTRRSAPPAHVARVIGDAAAALRHPAAYRLAAIPNRKQKPAWLCPIPVRNRMGPILPATGTPTHQQNQGLTPTHRMVADGGTSPRCPGDQEWPQARAETVSGQVIERRRQEPRLPSISGFCSSF